ncbi:MAG: hypothetical protein ACUZ8H_03685 [Candidatus Anammoxibacter sp.]
MFHVNEKVNRTLTKKRHSNTTISNTNIYTQYLAEQFKIFINQYPKKKSPKEAEVAWGQLWNGDKNKYKAGKLDNEFMQNILTAVKNQMNSREWTEDDGQYIPYPASWLRGHRWQDETESQTDKENEVVL